MPSLSLYDKLKRGQKITKKDVNIPMVRSPASI